MRSLHIVKERTDEAIRTELARAALCEMHFLMSILGREFDLAKTDTNAAIGLERVWPLLTTRIDDLNGVALTVVGGDELHETSDLLDTVYGEWVMATDDEASHD